MADQRKTNSDDSWFPWALIIFLFVVKAWPIALVMLLIKLFADDEKRSGQRRRPCKNPSSSETSPWPEDRLPPSPGSP